MRLYILCLTFLLSFSVFAKTNNLHLIDTAPNGFAVYRASQPDAKDMKRFCDLGITEMMVLSGSADDNEIRYQAICPTLKVVYNVRQSTKIPLKTSFLSDFDAWVEGAQAAGKKIAFRCECGCHRTGRLAAYYEMKYQGVSQAKALSNMKKIGKWMFLFPRLKPQVRSLNDFLKNEDCGEKRKYCVIKDS